MTHRDTTGRALQSASMLLPILLTLLLPPVVAARETVAATPLCSTTAAALNQHFNHITGLDSSGNIPLDSGVIVHTIHGPGPGKAELNMSSLNALGVDATKTCGQFMRGSPAVYLPWCGSNTDPSGKGLDDASSWTYLRHDTLRNDANLLRNDAVVCAAKNNKRYGLIFSNAYLKENGNLGCMYPLDGDSGNRSKMGCGRSENPNPAIIKADSHGRCIYAETLQGYLTEFHQLVAQHDSVAGSMVCSLSKSQFQIWAAARKQVDLSQTTWPNNEFVLFDWDIYATRDIADKGYLLGIYYLTGCDKTPVDGNPADAQAIADLYKKWSGVEVPVIRLSNAELRAKSQTPFSCP